MNLKLLRLMLKSVRYGNTYYRYRTEAVAAPTAKNLEKHHYVYQRNFFHNCLYRVNIKIVIFVYYFIQRVDNFRCTVVHQMNECALEIKPVSGMTDQKINSYTCMYKSDSVFVVPRQSINIHENLPVLVTLN